MLCLFIHNIFASFKVLFLEKKKCKETQEVINSCKTKKDKQYNDKEKTINRQTKHPQNTTQKTNEP